MASTEDEQAGFQADFEPSFPLVDAKLRRPVPPVGFVSRARLLDRLVDGRAAVLVSIIAPAGYGKTMLLADWASHEQRPVAWLSVDEFDNEASVFLTYLAAAIDHIRPIDGSINPMLTAPDSRILGSAVPRLASELDRWPDDSVLILDDIHKLVDRTCLDALALLLDHLPPSIQLVVAGRGNPGLPLARLRTERTLLEIDREALAFDTEEAQALSMKAGFPLSREESRTLAARTEGWAAAIYLSALTAGRVQEGANWTTTATDGGGYLAEYLRAALRTDLDDGDVTLLMRTSILDVVEPQLAEDVSGIDGAAQRISSLADGNQLISTVESPETSYRYHQLLRDYLRSELDRREPGAAKELHVRAATSYATAGRTELAIEHSLASGDQDRTAHLVLAGVLGAHYGGRSERAYRWLRSFDADVFARHPSLAVIGAWFHALNGRPDEAEQLAGIAERSTVVLAPRDGSASLDSAKAMLRAAMTPHGVGSMLADAALAAAAETPPSPWRSTAIYLLGSAHWLEGDTAQADDVLAEAIQVAAAAGEGSALGLATRAIIAMDAGEWQAADQFIRESHELGERAGLTEISTALIVHAVSARVALHNGDLPRAREELLHTHVVRPLATHVLPWLTVAALLQLGRCYLSMGDAAGAGSVVAQAEQIKRRRPDLGILTDQLAELRRRVDGSARTLAGPSTLTPAELRVLPMLSTYLSFEEIGDRLGVSRYTVKSQALAIYGKLGVSNRSEAIDGAIEIGLLEPFPGLRLTGTRP